MKSFKDYEELQNDFLRIVMPLAMVQEEIPPELFAPMADAFLKEFQQSKDLYEIEHPSKHQNAVAKYRAKLLRKGWRKQLREELGKQSWLDKRNAKHKKSEFELVKEKAVSEQSERIKSESGLCTALDKGEEPLLLEGQCEADNAAHCLIAAPSGAQPGQTEVDDMATPVDLSPGETD